MYVVVDIDGTLTKVGDRLKCLEQTPKDWDSFYARCNEDKPNWPIVHLVHALQREGYGILFCSGRRQSCLFDTMEWLTKRGLINGYSPQAVALRHYNDSRPDVEVKPALLDEWISKNHISRTEIAFILEDRSSMVKKWRELGYPCLQVAEGNY